MAADITRASLSDATAGRGRRQRRQARIRCTGVNLFSVRRISVRAARPANIRELRPATAYPGGQFSVLPAQIVADPQRGGSLRGLVRGVTSENVWRSRRLTD